jgi:hypothetical protein
MALSCCNWSHCNRHWERVVFRKSLCRSPSSRPLLLGPEVQGPAKGDQGGYNDHLAKYVRDALKETGEVSERARQHVNFRASTVLLIYTLAELAVLAAVSSECGAVTSGCWAKVGLVIASLILAVAGFWQNVITRRIDAAALHRELVK